MKYFPFIHEKSKKEKEPFQPLYEELYIPEPLPIKKEKDSEEEVRIIEIQL